MAPTSPVEEMVKLFRTKYSTVMTTVIDDLIKSIPSMTKYNMRSIITSILRKHNVSQVLGTELIKDVELMVTKTITAPVPSIMVKDAITSRSWSPDGVRFSTRVNDLTKIDQVFSTIRKGLTYGESNGAIAQKIFQTGVQKGDVSKLILQLEQSSRLLARNANDPNLARQFMRDVRLTQARVDRLVDPSSSTLRRAYQNVVDALKKLNEEAMTQAVKYAGYFKQRYNATRIADTEFARAYGNAVKSEAFYNENVTCLKVVLSSSHRITDICDFYAKADLYGRGEGVYPKELLPEYPFHPNCHCILDEVYEIEAPPATEEDFRSKGGTEYLRSISKEERQALLGVEGAKAFRKNPSTWQTKVRGYKPQERMSKPIIKYSGT